MHETRSGSSCRSAHQSGWVGGMLSVSCPSRIVYVAADSARELRCRSRVFGEPLRTLYSRRLQADHGSPALRRSPMCRAVPSVATACRASSANYVFLCLRANSESGRTLRRSPRHKRGVDLYRTSGSAPVTAGEAAGSAGWPFARSLSHFAGENISRLSAVSPSPRGARSPLGLPTGTDLSLGHADASRLDSHSRPDRRGCDPRGSRHERMFHDLIRGRATVGACDGLSTRWPP